jgi:leucyl aminopeptidase
MLDLATLTGAIVISLGEHTAGLFSNDEALAKTVVDTGKEVFEPFWHMPITDEAKEGIKGKVADITNSGGSRYGGAGKGAAFLERFVEKGVKWAHLDIAGPALLKAAKPPLCSDSTGFGTQTLLKYLFRKEEPKTNDTK